ARVPAAPSPGKALLLLLLGCTCPYGVTAGPSVEQDIHQYYESTHPGEVVVLGADLFNCAPSGLGVFEQNTGATFPLLLLSAVATGGNIWALYGERDHYVVINKHGIVRYQGNDRWPYGNGYHLDEIRACVDSLVNTAVGPHRRPVVRQPAAAPRRDPGSAPRPEPQVGPP